jgi:hypothetical protein
MSTNVDASMSNVTLHDKTIPGEEKSMYKKGQKVYENLVKTKVGLLMILHTLYFLHKLYAILHMIVDMVSE